MTISPKANGSTEKNVPRIAPPILLEKPEKKTLTKGEYHVHELRLKPADNDSQRMSYQFHALAQVHVKSV